MSLIPPIPVSFSSIYHRPSLVGITDDNQHIDLDGAKVEWLPHQDIMHSWGNDQIRISDIYPQTFAMTFTKPAKSPWVKWWADNGDIRFKVWHVIFRLDAVEQTKTKVKYRASGFLSEPPKT